MKMQTVEGLLHDHDRFCKEFGCTPVVNALGHDMDCKECMPTYAPTNLDPKVAEELGRIIEEPEERPTPKLDALMKEVRVTSATGGEKGSKLARFDLIPARAMWQVAELYGKGAAKYAPWNWRKGYDWSLSIAAAERHWSLFKQGEWLDEETKMPHLCSVVFHALTLLTFKDEQPDYDDRWKK